MSSIFNTLGIGYSGLSASQAGISTTSHNITNAETDGYTRQTAVTAAATPLSTTSGFVGNGTDVVGIKRIFDNFVFDRYTTLGSDKEYSDFEKKTLDQLSTYFPEIDNTGIKSDLHEYYNMWQTFSDNPDNASIKLALSKQTQLLSEHIKSTADTVKNLQSDLNKQLEMNVNEVNSLAKQLAETNRAIDTAEAGGAFDANDLRDKRNVLERDLSKLIGTETATGRLQSNIQINSNANNKTGDYSLSVNGLNLVDGATYHPIHISNTTNKNGFYALTYERQDGVLTPIEEKLNGGKIGAILALRGGSLDTTSGVPVDGVLQNTVAELNAFATGLIESTNNLYAESPTTKMTSNSLSIAPTDALMSSSMNFKKGSFNLVVYDVDGKAVATRKINIDEATTMTGAVGSNSIQAQMSAQVDDNADGNATNDVNSFLQFNWATYPAGDHAVEFSLNPTAESKGYTFAIADDLKSTNFNSGSNFAGALGMSRFFDGTNATNMSLTASLQINPTSISAGLAPVAGDNKLALNMIQQQFEQIDFKVGAKTYTTTSNGMFDTIATGVGASANAATMKNETISAQFNAVETEYFSTSKVNIDEEMTNLIKYQNSYGAAAKIITTIDQMMQTLLGIKQ
ncbi:MAG: flagellar hook-associated protein FlgK [Campylobacterales bacterium]|nr:flagellar hook-associated protein FlgK [Campylobacterales bacterium]